MTFTRDHDARTDGSATGVAALAPNGYATAAATLAHAERAQAEACAALAHLAATEAWAIEPLDPARIFALEHEAWVRTEHAAALSKPVNQVARRSVIAASLAGDAATSVYMHDQPGQ